MGKKRKKGTCKCCTTCENCIPIGEGDHICDEDPTRMVLVDYMPEEDYFWCGGRLWRER